MRNNVFVRANCYTFASHVVAVEELHAHRLFLTMILSVSQT